MPRFKLVIEYAGTKYSGWQIQKNARTVQGEIDRAIREVAGRREFELYGSGRTDAGVHALAQVAHLELYTSLAPEPLQAPPQRRAAGRHPHPVDRQGTAPLSRPARCRLAQLPLSDLAPAHGVRQAVRVVDPRAARSRRHATRRRGLRRPSGLRRLLGRRPRREIHRRRPRAPRARRSRRAVLVRVQGSHFLWKMVRRIVGVLAAVGRGEMKPADAARAAQRGRWRPGGRHAGRTDRARRWTVPGAASATKVTPAPGPVRPVIAID